MLPPEHMQGSSFKVPIDLNDGVFRLDICLFRILWLGCVEWVLLCLLWMCPLYLKSSFCWLEGVGKGKRRIIYINKVGMIWFDCFVTFSIPYCSHNRMHSLEDFLVALWKVIAVSFFFMYTFHQVTKVQSTSSFLFVSQDSPCQASAYGPLGDILCYCV